MMLEEVAEEVQELFVAVVTIPLVNDLLCCGEDVCIDDGLIRAVAPYPVLGLVHDAWSLEFGARAVVEVVANVLFVGEEFVYGAARPGSCALRKDAIVVQDGRDLRFRALFHGEEVIDATHGRDFQVRSGGEGHTLQLKTLALATGPESPWGWPC